MPRIKFPLKTLFTALALSGLANACAYSNYSAETGPETAHRFCLIGCGTDITASDPNFKGCCEFPIVGETVPSSCEALVSAATKTDCPTTLATTASVAMSAPTDYTPGYPTAAATAPVETSDTAGEAYTSDVAATAITTWVTETVSPDCSTVAPVETTAVPAETTPAPAETTPAPVESTPAPAETTPEPAATNTCACPAPDASAPPAETSDTEGESWVSSAAPAPTDGSEVPEYAGSKPESEQGGLDRRHDVAYTCPCPAPGAETSEIAGQSWTSSSDPVPAPEPTDDCEDDDGSEVPDYAGDKPTEDIHDNDPAKRFIPLDYPIDHPLAKKADYGPPPASFVPEEDEQWLKRRGPTGVIAEPEVSASPTTVTSTTTVTGTCPGAAAATPSAESWSQTPVYTTGTGMAGIDQIGTNPASSPTDGYSTAGSPEASPTPGAGDSGSEAPEYAGSKADGDVTENAEPGR